MYHENPSIKYIFLFEKKIISLKKIIYFWNIWKENFLDKKKYIFNKPIQMKFFLEIHQVDIDPKSLCILFPSSKLSQKNPLIKF